MEKEYVDNKNESSLSETSSFVEEQLLNTYVPNIKNQFYDFLIRQIPFFIGFCLLIAIGLVLNNKPSFLQGFPELVYLGLLFILLFMIVFLIGFFLYNYSLFTKDTSIMQHIKVNFYTTYLEYINNSKNTNIHLEKILYENITNVDIKNTLTKEKYENHILIITYKISNYVGSESFKAKILELSFVKTIDTYHEFLKSRIDFVKQQNKLKESKVQKSDSKLNIDTTKEDSIFYK